MSYRPIDMDDEMPFGKYKGETVSWIIDNDPDYLGWLLENTETEFSDDVLDWCRRAGY